MINEKRVLKRFLEYIQIDSPTKSEREFADFLMKEMQKIGFDVRMDKAGDKTGSNSGNLIATLKGTTDAEPILFSAHMDTVSPGIGIKPQIEDGTIYSDGTTVLGGDDKAGIASILEAIETALENDIDRPDIEVVFSIFEEGGLHGAKNLEYDKINSKIGFVLDSGGAPGQIINQGPAQDKIDVTFVGKTAHAGVAPETGISAISIASEAISNMKLLRIDEETTANIGSISGGDATNIVTERVSIQAEARSLDNDKLSAQVEHMVKCCEDAAEKFDGKVEVNIEHAYSAFLVEKDHTIIKKVEEACANLDLETSIVPSGGGSDTNILNGNGITAINLGVGMSKVHTTEEFIKIKDLEDSARLTLEIIKTFA